MTESHAKTLVLIDDDPDVLRATERILQAAGYQIITGGTAAEALELTRRHRPALLLLDVMLPDGNGLEVARQLKGEVELAGLFVILLSGFKTSGEDQAAGLSSGLADGYITRPFSKPEFLARIDAMLRLQAAQSSLSEALSRLHKIAGRVPGVVYQYRLRPDGSSCFPYASEAIRDIYRVSPEQVREDASPVFATLHPDDHYAVVASIQASAQTLTAWHCDYRTRFGDGAVRWLSGNAIPQREADGAILWHGFISDITERKDLEEQVRQLAYHDSLTGLPNRRLLDDRLDRAMAASKRSGRYGAIMFLDLDNFKALNDTHGHVIGDALLIEVASRLKDCVRGVDTVARFGGDEFVVLLAELVSKSQSAEHASMVAEKIRGALSKPYLLTIKRDGLADTILYHQCTASIGATLFLNHEASPSDLLKWADAAMYEAKAAGRNLVRFRAPEPSTQSSP